MAIANKHFFIFLPFYFYTFFTFLLYPFDERNHKLVAKIVFFPIFFLILQAK